MGRFKRKYGSKDSFSNLFGSNDGNKRSRIMSSVSGNGEGRSLSGSSRNFGYTRSNLHSTSQSSQNNDSQLSEIFAKYAYSTKTKENSQSANQDSTILKLSANSQNSLNNGIRTKKCSQLSEIFAKYGYSTQNKENSESTNQDDTILKISATSQNSLNNRIRTKKCRQLSEIFAKYGYSTQNKENSENTNQDDTIFKMSATSQDSLTASQLVDSYYKCIKKCNRNSVRDKGNEEKLFQHSTLKPSFSSDTYFDGQTCSESIKQHFSRLTQELIEEGDVDSDNGNKETYQNDVLEYNGFSPSKEFREKLDEFEFSKDPNEQFSKNIDDLPILESSTEMEAKNCNDDSFFDDIFEINQSNANSENTKLSTESVQSESDPFTLNNLVNQQETEIDCLKNEDYLKDISFESSEKVRKIHLEDFDLEQEASTNSSIRSYNNSEANVQKNLDNSLSSGALSTGSKMNFNDAAKRLRAGLNHISRDKSLIYRGSGLILDVNLSTQKKDLIRSKIEQILQWFCESITENKPLVFKVRNNRKWSNFIFQNDVLKLKPPQESIFQESIFTEIKFNSRMSRQRFNLILYLLTKNRDLLQTDSFSTQREIYYQIKNFLYTQNQIRDAMNTISSMLEIEPWYFPIVSTSKGLVFGDLSVIISEEETVRCNAFGGTLIPQDVTKIREFKSKAFFILVVEKDAIFKKLLDEDIPNQLTRPFIIITGKGFPDINTRLFVKKLWMSLRIPVFILVDADPDGIDIMLTYRFGSQNMAHVSEELALPHIRWLGVFPSEINQLKITHQPLNDLERNKIRGMLKRPYMETNPWLKRELEILQDNNVKAEIEGVIKSTAFLTDVYLPYKFCSRDYF